MPNVVCPDSILRWSMEGYVLKRCPNCQRIMDDDLYYCRYCGAELEIVEDDEDDELIEEFLILELTDEDDEIDE